MTILCICVGTEHKSYERDPPEVSPKPWKKSTEGTTDRLHKGTFVLLVDSIKFIVLVLKSALWIPASALNDSKVQ